MPFKTLMLFMLSMVKSSSNNALERFFSQLKEAFSISQQAFSRGRQKVHWRAFAELFHTSVAGSYNEEIKGWHGYLLMAIDSSHVALPRDAALADYYGATGNELSAPTARASMLYDIENDIIVDAIIEKLSIDERTLAHGHIEAFQEKEDLFAGWESIFMYDRGYPSRDLIKYLQDKEIKYVMRVSRRFSAQIEKMETGSAWIDLSDDVRVRVLTFSLSTGERETLITNIGEDELADEEFPALYYRRWPIETKYNQVKQKLELENFSGRLVDNIKQDFYAMMTVSNMLASLLREANAEIREDEAQSTRRYEYRANVNHAVGVLKDKIVGLLIADDPLERQCLYKELVAGIKRRIVPIRPNRSPPHRHYIKPHFHFNHKSNC